MAKLLKSQAAKGVVWSTIERFSVQGIQFALSLVLARLVAPAEYGLIAMLTIFISIAQGFVDSGFSNALIQKKNRTSIDITTVFYINIVSAVVIYAVLFLCAPYIAEFYDTPILKTICRVLSLDIIINAFALAQRTILQINIDFRRLTKVSFISVAISGVVGIIFAWKGMGVWALLIQRLVNSFLQMFFLWFISSWRPLYAFSWESFKTLFSFGSKLLFGGMLHSVYMNLYPLIIGRFFTPANVGFFNWAQQFAVFPSSNISYVISRVSYPLLCKMQDDDIRLEATQLRVIRSTAYFVFPLMIGLAILSKPLVLFLLTKEWLPATPMLSILCLSYMWYPVMAQNCQILSAKGRSDLLLKAEIYKKIVALLLLLISIPFGLFAVCMSLAIYSFCDMYIILLFVRKVTNIGFLVMGKLLMPVFIISVLMGVGVWIIKEMITIPIVALLTGIVGGAVIYVVLTFMAYLPEKEYLKRIVKYEKIKM